ncbi:MAG: hypothetical protein KKH12_11195 [Gammaproteobacteria bacterium]|nr:hypothetical protein [Gammaproteobacteria bacterium]MBU1482223.1 hypothetical protein [Gammaproteobacteria bacterium]
MKLLHLIIPDLIPPQDIAAEVCAGLHLPALEKLLARGKASALPAEILEDRLCDAFGVQSVAPVRAAADGLEVGGRFWMCADPVNLHLQGAQMLLFPQATASMEEASGLCDCLNEHFAGTGLQFFAPHPQRWYVQVEAEPQLTNAPLRQVAWRDARYHPLQGDDAMHWQRILTEVQMLLHGHALNLLRAARGESIINSLWLWGGGRAAPSAPAFDAVGGDDGLIGAFTRAAGMQQIESLQVMLDGQDAKGLWVCDAAGEALQRGDLYAWREAVLHIERQYAQPLLQALQAGKLQRLSLDVLREHDMRHVELTSGAAWKLWLGAKPLLRYAV